MENFISVIIPNYNGSATIGKCLEAAFASSYKNFEVIVVDDCSTDNSISIIERFRCRLVKLETHAGAGKARNEGALQSKGHIFFFTDADCLLSEGTLPAVNRAVNRAGSGTVIGGSYTPVPVDDDFFSTFQSVFVYYSETKNMERPDYIAGHAMAMHAQTFAASGGFREEFLPILEDVEFSHRLVRNGFRLAMDPEISVRHIFNFNFKRSFMNAYRKTRYWMMYSFANKDVLRDSGTASAELKMNGLSWPAFPAFALLSLLSGARSWLIVPCALAMINILVSRRLIAEFYKTKGLQFTLSAALYYVLLYPVPVWAGAFAGIAGYFGKRPILHN